MFKKLILCGAVVGSLIGSQVHGQFSVNISVDEGGIGTFSNSSGFSAPLPPAWVADPNPGGLNHVLFYGTLNPPGLQAGDVVIYEPDRVTVSDVIRFDPRVGGGGFFFYSEAGDPNDSGLPSSYDTTYRLVEPVEGVNETVVWTPIAGQPGFVAGAAGPVTYTFDSLHGVPDGGATFGLMGLGVIALALARRLT